MAGYVPDIIPPAALRCRDTFLTGMLEMQVRKKTLEGIDAMHFQIIQPSVQMLHIPGKVAGSRILFQEAHHVIVERHPQLSM